MKRVTKLLALVVPLLFAAQAFGQSGKIAGRVVDAGTGDGLPGVNVAIEGTTVGTVSDVEGYYTIINVRPATYSVRASFVGYTPEIVEGVRVSTGLTTEINFNLREQVVEGEELVVTAERPIVQLDVSANVASLNPAEFVDLPVAGVNEVIDLQAGIEPGLQIRGGGSNEIAFVVDGMNLRTGREQRPITNISYTALEEVQVQTGGFNAEYGNVRAGIVNVTTKEPSRTRYSFDGMFRFAPAQDRSFEPFTGLPDDISECNFPSHTPGQPLATVGVDPTCNSWYVRPFIDPATSMDGTGGVYDGYDQNNYNTHQGWNAIASEQQTKGFDVTGQDMYDYYIYTHRKDNSITKPDYEADVTIGGPLIPGVSNQLGDIRFLASYRGTQTPYLIPQEREAYTSNTFQGKIIMNPRTNMKLAINGMILTERGIVNGQSANTADIYSGWITRYPWGGGVDAYARTSRRGDDIWTGHGYANSNVDQNVLGGTFTHSINANTFYEIGLQNVYSKQQAHFPDLRDLTFQCPQNGIGPDGNPCDAGEAKSWLFTDNFGTLKPEYQDRVGVDQDGDGHIDVTCFGGGSDINGDGRTNPYCVGEEPFGWGAVGGNLLGTQESTGGHWVKTRDTTTVNTFTGRFDLTSQVNRFMQLKTGAELIFSDYDVDWLNITVGLGGRGDNSSWARSPIQGAWYAQTKLEFQGMIANLGLRLDYFDANSEWWVFEGPFDQAYRFDENWLDENLSTSEPDAQLFLSPRVGISFPITEDSKLYFNYGHFRQQLQPFSIFGVRSNPASGINQIGNPDHPMPQTVAYELGFDQNVLDQFLLRVSGFYRDIRQQPASIAYNSLGNIVQYSTRMPWSYEDVRGVELTLSKTRGRFLRGFVNYTYLQRKSGEFGYDTFYENSFEQLLFLRDDTDYRLNAPLASPFARINAIFLSPQDWNPVLADWRVSLLGEWRDGEKWRWQGGGTTYPELQENVAWRDFWNWELRLTKHIMSSLGDLQLFVDVDNLFNRRHIWRNGGFAGSDFPGRDFDEYMWSLHLPEDTYDKLNDIEAGDAFGDKMGTAPYRWIPGSDKPGDFRNPDVEFQPMEAWESLDTVPESELNTRAWYWAADTETYSRWTGSGWEAVPQADVDKAIGDKAYIDMPNIRHKAFLNPRRFTLGVRISI